MLRSFIALLAVFAASCDEEGSTGLSGTSVEAFCKPDATTARRTSIILDLARIPQDDPAWATPLLNKLELQPREPIEVLAVDPNTNVTKELFSSCYPLLTDEEKANSKAGWLDQEPEQVQAELLLSFGTKLNIALSDAVKAAAAANASTSDMISILSAQANRYKDDGAFHRIIIYSSMDSDIADAALSKQGAEQEAALTALFANYSLNLGLAEFFVYGADSQASNAQREFWEEYFLSQGSILTAMSPNLQVEKSASVDRIVSRKGTWSLAGDGGAQAKLVFAVEADGRIPLGSAGFFIGTNWVYAPFSGSYVCSGGTCSLKATVLRTVPFGHPDPFFEKEIDRLELQGSDTGLSGRLVTGRVIKTADGMEVDGYELSLAD